jgi:hypothetical protein
MLGNNVMNSRARVKGDSSNLDEAQVSRCNDGDLWKRHESREGSRKAKKITYTAMLGSLPHS